MAIEHGKAIDPAHLGTERQAPANGRFKIERILAKRQAPLFGATHSSMPPFSGPGDGAGGRLKGPKGNARPPTLRCSTVHLDENFGTAINKSLAKVSKIADTRYRLVRDREPGGPVGKAGGMMVLAIRRIKAPKPRSTNGDLHYRMPLAMLLR